ncbi:MAG: mucoidy inhibitor MuiA family protein, partial [Tannerella sp.]|nr:mucoidy inhibitor MuiA family protein [Tannerella sp.]
ETWRNVRLKVSSANPNLGNVAPKLKTYLLDYHTRPPRYNTDNLSNQVGGRVMDGAGEPLVGASVSITGSTIGTVSDLSGRYSLAIPAGGGDLSVSYIGYKTKTAPIVGSDMDIMLEEDDAQLDEVMVVGYATDNMMVMEEAAELPHASSRQFKTATRSVPVPVKQVETTTAVEFDVKTPYTIPSENRNITIELEHYSVPAEYEYYSVPKIRAEAFLLANISGWEQYNLLEGEANIFFENTFVGKTILDVRSLGDTLSLSLGRDKNVSVKREKVREYSTQKFLGSRTETTRDWKITVRNNRRQPVAIVIFDQIPVSTLQEIEVNTENLSGGTLDGETGEVKWKLTLQPAQTSELDLRYRVKYPKGKSLFVE